MNARITDEMVEAALAAFNKTINDPKFVRCERCGGKGYHHGFGEQGHDPDWCANCGGGGYDIVPGEEARAMRAALEAAAVLSQPEAEGLSPWMGWDQARPPWGECKHKDAVLAALFRAPWSVEDAATLIGFIERTWPRATPLTVEEDNG